MGESYAGPGRPWPGRLWQLASSGLTEGPVYRLFCPYVPLAFAVAGRCEAESALCVASAPTPAPCRPKLVGCPAVVLLQLCLIPYQKALDPWRWW